MKGAHTLNHTPLVSHFVATFCCDFLLPHFIVTIVVTALLSHFVVAFFCHSFVVTALMSHFVVTALLSHCLFWNRKRGGYRQSRDAYYVNALMVMVPVIRAL